MVSLKTATLHAPERGRSADPVTEVGGQGKRLKTPTREIFYPTIFALLLSAFDLLSPKNLDYSV